MRRLECVECGRKYVATAAKYGEEVISVEGYSKGNYNCDSCAIPINPGDPACALTSHPKGASLVAPWAHDYLEMRYVR